MMRLVARAAAPSINRRRSTRPFYRYTLTSLESLFAPSSMSDEFDRHHDHAVARRVFGFGLIVLIVAMVGLAIVLRQLVHIVVGLLG